VPTSLKPTTLATDTVEAMGSTLVSFRSGNGGNGHGGKMLRPGEPKDGPKEEGQKHRQVWQVA